MSKGKKEVFKPQTYVTQSNYNPADYPGMDFTGQVSYTVPDQAKSIQEIIDDFTTNMLIPRSEEVWLGEDEVPMWETMDAIERVMAAAEARHEVARRRKAYDDAIAAGKDVQPEDFIPKDQEAIQSKDSKLQSPPADQP